MAMLVLVLQGYTAGMVLVRFDGSMFDLFDQEFEVVVPFSVAVRERFLLHD